jgi:hypothetical protein
MISYSTNYMGPINADWIKTHGEHWAGGRIDIYGSTEDEIGLPIMHVGDWRNFSTWLDEFKTEAPFTLDKILEAYYNDGHDEIRWWKR